MSEQNRIKFCTIEKLDGLCQEYLKWVIEGTRDCVNSTAVKWLLAHCHDGVTWGIFENLAWSFSSAAFPEVSPSISENNLLELRLFGDDSEVLIWRTDEGFSGRRLKDNGEPDKNDPCRPDKESRILLGDRFIDIGEGFTHVGTARGLQHAVPLECTADDFAGGRWPLRLEVKHYFEQDEDTGMVRVSASRLVNVYKEV